MNNRPIRKSDEILRPAMRKLFENDIKKLNDYSGGDDEDCIGSLVKNYRDDGYEFAKALDDNDGWMVDFQLCEALDSGSQYVYSQYTAAQKEWAAANPLTLYNVGDEVIVTLPYSSAKGKKCIITSVKKDTIEYTVIEKEKYTPNKIGGYVLEHENLQLVNG